MNGASLLHGAPHASRRTMDTQVPLVVIADRDRLHEAWVTSALGELGYDVETARSVWQLHRMLEERAVDALLVDVVLFGSSMPLLRSVVAPRRPRLVVLMLCVGSGLTPDAARTSGFDACFSKIVDVAKIDRFLRDRLPVSRRPLRRRANELG